jgi:hypothetical protein
LRQGTAFWQLLADHGVPATIIRIPNNFPPLESKARSLAGMGTPDLQGGFGTFTFFTDDPLELTHDVAGGRVVKVRLQDGAVVLSIPGPSNTLRTDRAQTSMDLAVAVDPLESVARFRAKDSVFILKEHEWSGWIRASFPLIPIVKPVRGMFRVYAKEFHPVLQIYVSPVNFDPSAPEVPLSTPASYSRQMAAAIGPFYTQGIAEDTAVYRAGLIDRHEYLAQSGLVFEEQFAMLREVVKDFKCGFSRNRSLILSSNRSPFSGSRSARSERSDAGFLIVTGSDRNGKRFFLNPERSAGWPAGSRDGGRGKGRRLRPFPSVLSDPGAALYRSGSWGGFLRIDSPRSSMR